MKKNISHIIATALLLLTACSEADIKIAQQTDQEVDIAPDYKEVTIPQNIAPLNFQTELENAGLVISDGSTTISVKAKDKVFHIPMKKWKQLLLR